MLAYYTNRESKHLLTRFLPPLSPINPFVHSCSLSLFPIGASISRAVYALNVASYSSDMTNHLVSRFRVKKLSPKQRLPIYKASQLPDLVDEAIKLNRSVPVIETGVEKEEEEEV